METYIGSVCLVGDTFTGKSTFLSYMKTNTFNPLVLATIGVDLNAKLFSFNNYNIKWQIWDISGDDIFYDITSRYFKKVTIFLLFFDLNNRKSFLNLDNWIRRIKFHSKSNYKLILIGNKSDLKQHVEYQEVETFCKKYNIDYFQISINYKNNIEIYYIMDHVNDYLKKIIDTNRENIDRYNVRLLLEHTVSTNRYCCIFNCILS